MSTKTTFKRIALAVVAVMGLGVLAAGPSSATVISFTAASITVVDGTATTVKSDSTTAATVQVKFTASGSASDSATMTSFISSAPATSAYSGRLVVRLTDTATSTANPYINYNAVATSVGTVAATSNVRNDSATVVAASGTTANTYAARFGYSFETTTGLVAGTYVITSIITPFSGGVQGTAFTKDVSIVVSATAAELATASTVIDASKTVAILTEGGNPNESISINAVDSAVAASSAASGTAVASFKVKTFNAQGVAKPESVTVTMTGAGSLVTGSVTGNSFTLTGASGESDFDVIANGVAGVGSIVISTTTKTFAPKLVTFYATAPATIVPAVEIPVIATGALSDVLALDAKDANGNIWAGQAYLFSTDTAVATAGACTYNTTDKVHYCAVTGVAAGQSKFRVGNASTLAASTVAIAEFNGPRVSIQTPASVKIEFDKATYQPGEKAKVYITVLDAAGNTLPSATYTNVFTSTGIAASIAFATGGESLTATSISTAASTSALTLTRAGSAMYSMTMGTASGTVELTAKGGTGLPLAGQVAVTASAEVTNSAEDAANEALDAAIAATDASILAEEAAANAEAAATAAAETAEAALDAVTALSAQVTKLVSQLASLQKLVNKIAKRVGAKK